MNDQNATSTTFRSSTTLPTSAERAYAWHLRPGALSRLTPPWSRVEVLSDGGLREGHRTTLRVWIAGLPFTWVAEHRDVEPGRGFRDIQLEGPFHVWEHQHRLSPLGGEHCRYEDEVRFVPPLGPLGQLAKGRLLRELERAFRYRHQTLAADLALHDRYALSTPLTVAVSGAGGLLGRVLVPLLSTGGHRVLRLVRHRPRSVDEIEWSPHSGVADPSRLEGIDALVHLAGEGIAARRWSDGQKRRIRRSRIDGTTAIVRSLRRLAQPPATFVNASAVGAYGDAGGAPLDETAPRGTGFLAEVCADWEAAALQAEAQGLRTVCLRFGTLLSPAGGALSRMLPPFRAGLGGVLGSGRQVVSWASVDDAAAAVLHVLATPTLRGPINVTTPQPVTNRQLTNALGTALGRPTVLPLPATVARFAFGELADELLLGGARVEPAKLLASGFSFRHPEINDALAHLLGLAPEQQGNVGSAGAELSEV